MTVGTVNYAAPEQLRGEQIDGHADQYSLAATAYHLLTGAAPFANSNPAIVISHHLDAKPPPIGAGHPDLVRLGPVFAKALAKDPADRFDQCRDFAMAMQDALGPAGGVMARHRKPDAGPGRKRLLAAAAVAVIVAGVVGVVVAVVRTHLATRGDSGGGSEQTTPPPPAVSARMDLPVVVIGAECAVLGAAAVNETGAAAYCARVDSQGQETVWSVQPERLRPSAAQPLPTP
jgi:serine/threonine-protein kinase